MTGANCLRISLSLFDVFKHPYTTHKHTNINVLQKQYNINLFLSTTFYKNNTISIFFVYNVLQKQYNINLLCLQRFTKTIQYQSFLSTTFYKNNTISIFFVYNVLQKHYNINLLCLQRFLLMLFFLSFFHVMNLKPNRGINCRTKAPKTRNSRKFLLYTVKYILVESALNKRKRNGDVKLYM